MRMTEQETIKWTIKYNEWTKNCLNDFEKKFGPYSTTIAFVGALEAFKLSVLKNLVGDVEE
jgi:hypothetical protein